VNAEIVSFSDGPYLVRGPFRLVDEDDADIGDGRTTVALCGCGRSRTAPFCDGSHKRGGRGAARRRAQLPDRRGGTPQDAPPVRATA
jgi:CDGSH-type Zn-finger protein